jgi:hypothetical protein
MARTITLTNVSGVDKTYGGQTILDTETYTLTGTEYQRFKQNAALFADVADGSVLVGNGTADFNDPVEGWEWLQNEMKDVVVTQQTKALGGKVAVHSSPKPQIEGIYTYAVWSGAGDNLDTGTLGDGDLLIFNLQQGIPTVTKRIEFDAAHGRTWIHEGYVKVNGGGIGDYMEAITYARATPLQQVAQLDLELDGEWVKFAAGGAGSGTHGFADPALISLVPRYFAHDGDWNYDLTTNSLTPNLEGTGLFKISTVDKPVHKFINKLPCFGTTSSFVNLNSEETSEVYSNYYIDITAHNISDTTWDASVIIEIYRQRTIITQ